MDKAFISTFYGHNFDPTQPTAEDICLEDIAHALSMLSRANGHFREFYSVGRHSLNCAYEAEARGLSEKVQLIALLHDSAECYIGDLTRPLRRHLPEFTDYERALQKLIFEKYATLAITDEERQAVRDIDDSLLYHEFCMFHGAKLFDTAPPLCITLGSDKTPTETETEFLNVYQRLHESLVKA